MLSLPDLDPVQEIVADNIRMLGSVYFASQLEEMRIFQVVERLVQLFDEGLLPLARRGRGQRLLRRMAAADDRLSRASSAFTAIIAAMKLCTSIRIL